MRNPISSRSTIPARARQFVESGFAEGRSRDTFDAEQYLANYADLRAAFGNDLHNATRHYILFGYYEGRTDEDLTPITDDGGGDMMVAATVLDKGEAGPEVLLDDAGGVLDRLVDTSLIAQINGDAPTDLCARDLNFTPDWAAVTA